MSLPVPKSGILKIDPYKQGKYATAPGARCIKLSSNENPYGPSPKAIAAYREAATLLNRYPDGGCVALREAIGEVHGLHPDKIVCGAGSDELIGLLIHSYAGPGDEVLYTEHGFLMYKIYTLSAGATPVEAKETKLRADIDQLLAKVTERTRLVFIANPNNPTGTHVTREELTRLRRELPEQVILAVDAAYAECVTAEDCPDGRELAETTPNTVMLRTFSKVYGLPALRLGWMYGPAGIVDVINRARSPFNVSATAQATAIAAVRDVEYTRAQAALNAEAREALADAITALGYYIHPSQGNFLLADFGSAEQAAAINRHLVSQGIYVRDVTAYKLPHCLRITVGTAEENEALLTALADFVAQAA